MEVLPNLIDQTAKEKARFTVASHSTMTSPMHKTTQSKFLGARLSLKNLHTRPPLTLTES